LEHRDGLDRLRGCFSGLSAAAADSSTRAASCCVAWTSVLISLAATELRRASVRSSAQFRVGRQPMITWRLCS
jgi:hypothetical protein